MADNVAITAGAGTTIATDDIGGGVQVQRVKATFGTDGTATDVSAANPLPVDASGTVTEEGVTAHDAVATSTDPVLVGGYASAAAPTDVSADGDAVRAWMLRNGAQCAVLTAAGALIGGDAANGLDVDVTRVIPGTSATHLGKAEDAAHASGDTGVMVLAVRRDSAASGTSADGDYAALSVDVNGALRVTGGTQYAEDVASASGDAMTTAGTVRQDTPATSSSTDGDYQPLKTDSVGRLHVNGSGVNQPVVGAAAHDAAVSGNPCLAGMEARTAVGTAVQSGDVVRAQADVFGKQVVILGALHEEQLNGLTNYTTNSGADLIAAQGAGIKIAVTSVLVTNAHATVGTKVSIRDGTTARITGYAAPAGGGFALNAGGRPLFITAANAALTAICGTTGADVDVSVSGYLVRN